MHNVDDYFESTIENVYFSSVGECRWESELIMAVTFVKRLCTINDYLLKE